MGRSDASNNTRIGQSTAKRPITADKLGSRGK
jgi:hypothetical protein